MSVYDKNRETVRGAADAVRAAQAEIATLSFDDPHRRERLIGLVNNISERLVEVSDSLVEDEDRFNYEDQPAQEVRANEDRVVAKEDKNAKDDKRPVKDAPRPQTKR